MVAESYSSLSIVLESWLESYCLESHHRQSTRGHREPDCYLVFFILKGSALHQSQDQMTDNKTVLQKIHF